MDYCLLHADFTGQCIVSTVGILYAMLYFAILPLAYIAAVIVLSPITIVRTLIVKLKRENKIWPK
jgi:hypothetical protein